MTTYETGFGSETRKAAAASGVDIAAMIYDAAKATSKARQKRDDNDPEAHVISDFGADLFADAKTV